MQKDMFSHAGGGEHFSETFFYFLCVNSKKEFQPTPFTWYLSSEKNAFADNLRVEPTNIFVGKIVFFEPFLWPFLWAIVHEDCPRSFIIRKLIFTTHLRLRNMVYSNIPSIKSLCAIS